MDDDAFHLVFSSGGLRFAFVVSSNADFELSWVVDILENTVSSSDDGLGRDDGTSAHGTTVLQHKDLPRPRSRDGIGTCNHTLHLDGGVTATGWEWWWDVSGAGGGWWHGGSSTDFACLWAYSSYIGADSAVIDVTGASRVEVTACLSVCEGGTSQESDDKDLHVETATRSTTQNRKSVV